jgi:protein-S-isoprenylcysteine O-methyltransferase Ste14
MTPSVAKYLFLFALIVFGAIRFPREWRGRKVAVARSYYGWREWFRVSAATWGLAVIPVIDATTSLVRGADLTFRPWLAWIGAAVFTVALGIFWSAHRELGRNFSPSLVVREQHTLVTGGLYGYIRHPMYTAFWLWVIAQALLLQNWIVAIGGFAGWGILFFDRIGQEEALMRETFGEQYDAFARRTKRLVPWIY